MTLRLELTPEEESRLQQAAAKRGMEAGAYLRSLIPMETENDMPLPKRRQLPTPERRHDAPLHQSVMGKYADVPTSSEAFVARKRAEKAKEDRRTSAK